MKAKIMIVDDEEMLTNILKMSLEVDDRFEVAAVVDPLEAMDVALAFSPDLVVLDIIMPHKDGLSVARDLRAHPELKKIPIIFLSATAVKRESGAWLNTDEGMYKKLDSNILEQSTLVEKPVTTEVLIEEIEAHLGGN